MRCCCRVGLRNRSGIRVCDGNGDRTDRLGRITIIDRIGKRISAREIGLRGVNHYTVIYCCSSVIRLADSRKYRGIAVFISVIIGDINSHRGVLSSDRRIRIRDRSHIKRYHSHSHSRSRSRTVAITDCIRKTIHSCEATRRLINNPLGIRRYDRHTVCWLSDTLNGYRVTVRITVIGQHGNTYCVILFIGKNVCDS